MITLSLTQFLQRSRTTHGSEKRPTFTFKERDEAVIPREDVVKKLPPTILCGRDSKKRETICLPLQLETVEY